MAALETLERDYPLIDSAFRGFCSSLGIFSVEDFLLYDSHALEDRLERAPEKFKQGMLQLYSVVESYHRPWLNGLELLEDVEQNKFLISTGCEGIDTLLQGGVRIGQLTELVGPPSSGKTQVCLKTASHVAQEYSSTVLYVDTSNSFSPKQVVGFLTQSSTPVKTEKTVEQVLRSIACHRIFDIFSLLDMLHLLKNRLKSQIHSHVKMLIIDSLSSLIAPILGGGSADGHALMITVSYLLKELAHDHNISVMVLDAQCPMRSCSSITGACDFNAVVHEPYGGWRGWHLETCIGRALEKHTPC